MMSISFKEFFHGGFTFFTKNFGIGDDDAHAFPL